MENNAKRTFIAIFKEAIPLYWLQNKLHLIRRKQHTILNIPEFSVVFEGISVFTLLFLSFFEADYTNADEINDSFGLHWPLGT